MARSRRHDKPRQLQRMLRILSIIEGEKEGVTADYLSVELGVSTRTIFRDIAVLRDSGARVDFDQKDRTYKLGYGDLFLPPLNFTVGEALGLLVGAGAMGAHKASPLAEVLKPAASKLRASLSDKNRKALEELKKHLWVGMKDLSKEMAADDILEKLNQAVRGKTSVDMTYKAPGKSRASQRRFDPYGVFYQSGAWYVLGWCQLRDEIRMFRLSRIKKLEPTAREFTRPGNFSMKDHLEKAWGLHMGKETTVSIRFDKSVAEYITEAIWHPTQKVDVKDDGSVVLTVTVAGTEEIKRWALSWGQFAEILKPPQLRKEVAGIIRKLSRRYGSSK